MKKLNNIALTLMVTVLVTGGAAEALAGGSCGSSKKTEAKHASYDEAKTPAIFPLAEQAGFNTLTAAVKAAGLEETLTNGGPFTVFAPTDEAFNKLPEGTVDNLLANPEKLKKVLLYHVVDGNVMAKDVVKLDSARTLNGAKVAINTKDGVKVNDSNVIQTDIQASNGTVHVIDTVLIPENL
jgi:uncharacterized surface protein with fasciclin (FAS1) repeats